MQYNIIGDIHGRPVWKDLVLENCVNIFVGDYFDPYDSYSYDELMKNMLDILQYKRDHSETVLLLGNHDLHYFHRDDTSRMNTKHEKEIKQMFLNNIHQFMLAYSIQNKVLVTHAGVTEEWLELTEYAGTKDPDNIADHINNLFLDGLTETETDTYFDPIVPYGMQQFTFSRCMGDYDIYGTSATQSPVWVRPQTLAKYNAIPDYVQVVGHTQVDHIEQIPYPIWLIDCLGQTPGSLLIKTDNNAIEYVCNNPKTSRSKE